MPRFRLLQIMLILLLLLQPEKYIMYNLHILLSLLILQRETHTHLFRKLGAEAPNTTCSTCLIFAQRKVRFYIILVPPPLLLLLYITAEVYLTKPKKDTLYLSIGKYYFFKVLFVLPT